MRRPQPRAARRLDLAAVLILLVAVAVYGCALLGMRELERVQPVADVRAQPIVFSMGRYHGYLRMSRAGLALGAVGLACAVAGATVTARDRRRHAAVALAN